MSSGNVIPFPVQPPSGEPARVQREVSDETRRILTDTAKLLLELYGGDREGA